MSQQPQRAYQRPAPPPLYPLRGEGPAQVDQPKDWNPNPPTGKGGGGSKLKWLLIAAGVFIAAIFLAILTMGGSGDNQSVSQNPYKPQEAPKPSGSFTQNYRLTETQGRKAVTVQQVRVSGLNQNKAKVSYLVSYSPTLTWPAKPSSYLFKSGGNFYKPQVKTRRVGTQGQARVSFRLSTSRVLRAGQLILQPQQAAPLQVALEIPARQRDQVVERSGTGPLG